MAGHGLSCGPVRERDGPLYWETLGKLRHQAAQEGVPRTLSVHGLHGVSREDQGAFRPHEERALGAERDHNVSHIQRLPDRASAGPCCAPVFDLDAPEARGLVFVRHSSPLEVFKLKLDPRTDVRRLSIAEQSLVQIARAVYLNPKILILDEPTSTLSMDQKDNIFQIIKGLCRENRTTVLHVSHRREEIIALGDRVTVLRDGRHVGTRNVRETNLNEIISMMVGREIEKINRTDGRRIGRPLLKAESLTRKGVFRDITFELREGEVLGYAGFVGAGRTELMRAIFGLDHISSGHLFIDG